MIISVNFEYYKHWSRWFKYKADTPTYNLFIRKMDLDKDYKEMVDGYINMFRTPEQKQKELEKTMIFH